MNVGEADYNFQKSEARGEEQEGTGVNFIKTKTFFKVVMAMLIFLIDQFSIYFNMSYNIFSINHL